LHLSVRDDGCMICQSHNTVWAGSLCLRPLPSESPPARPAIIKTRVDFINFLVRPHWCHPIG
jgi:hypothetical protein